MDLEIKVFIFMIGMFVVVFGVPCILKKIFKLAGIPHIPQEFEADKAQVVCDSNTFIYSFAMLICGSMGALCAYGCIVQVLKLSPVALGFAFTAVATIALASAFFMIIKNRVILLFYDKIIFRDTFGKVFIYNAQQIEKCYYVGGKNRFIRIKMKDGKAIHIESEGTSFWKALEFVRANYHFI